MTDPVLSASEASPEDADRLVAALPPDAQEAVIEAWLEAEDGERLRAIADGGACAAATRKLARKSIHLLKTRGVAVPESTRPAALTPLALPAEPDRGWISAVDGAGYQVFVLAYGVPGGGFRGALGVRGGAEGIHEAVPFECAKRRLKELVDNAETQLGGRIVAVDPAYLRWRVERSIRKATASGSSAADRVANASARWPVAPPGSVAHPARALSLPQTGAVGAQSFDEADGVLSIPELRGWVPPRAVLDEMAGALEALDRSLAVVSPEAGTERWIDTILDGVAKYFGEEARREFALDLEDTALCVAAEERASDAAAMLRAANDVRDLNLPPADVGVLRLYFERCFEPPAARSAPEKPEKRSKGGIILP
jgi:hypothetical protein